MAKKKSSATKKKNTNSKSTTKKKNTVAIKSAKTTSKKPTTTKKKSSNSNSKKKVTKKVELETKKELIETEKTAKKTVEKNKKIEKSNKDKVIELNTKEEVKPKTKKELRKEKKEEKKKAKELKKVKRVEKKTKKQNLKRNKQKISLINRFKRMSTMFKVLIVVSIICSIVLIVEGILLINHKAFIERNTIYHDTYTGAYLGDNILAIAGSTDFKYGNFKTRIKENERGKLTVFDEKGNVTLEKVYKKGITTTFNSVLAVDDGYIVVGTGIFSKEELEKEAQEAFIIKYSLEGKILWEKFYQVLTNTSFNKIIKTNDGYIVIGQSIYANMEMGNHTTGGGIIVKYDKKGNELWHNNHGGTKSGTFNDIVEVNGEYYVVGKDGTDWGNLVKFSNTGEYIWHKNYSYTDDIGFTNIEYADNNLYVTGSKKILRVGIKDEDDRSTLNTDALFIKYDMDGNIVFEKTYGGSSYERYNSLAFYHNNFYVVGHTCSNDAGVKVTTDKKDEMTGFIIRYDINANILKKEPLGGSNNDNLVDIVTDGVSFYVVGYSNSRDGNITGSHANGKDYYGKLIKLNNKFQKLFVK